MTQHPWLYWMLQLAGKEKRQRQNCELDHHCNWGECGCLVGRRWYCLSGVAIFDAGLVHLTRFTAATKLMARQINSTALKLILVLLLAQQPVITKEEEPTRLLRTSTLWALSRAWQMPSSCLTMFSGCYIGWKKKVAGLGQLWRRRWLMWELEIDVAIATKLAMIWHCFHSLNDSAPLVTCLWLLWQSCQSCGEAVVHCCFDFGWASCYCS